MFSRNDAGKLYFTPTRNVKYNAFHKSRRIARSARLNRPTNTTVRPDYNIVSSGFFFLFGIRLRTKRPTVIQFSLR